MCGASVRVAAGRVEVMQDALNVPNGAPELLRLRDAYLEVWSDLAGKATLRRSVSLACRVGRVARAMAWQRALRDTGVPVDEAFRGAPAAWLAELPADTAV